MKPWEEFRQKYPSGAITYMVDGRYLGVIKINTLNMLCGYVILPKNHPYIGLDLYEGEYNKNPLNELRVHGGVTFADYIGGYGYAIGFDCAHAIDYGVWRDEAYVINELKRLAEQLKEVELRSESTSNIGKRAYETLKRIRTIVKYYFEYPCDFGEISLNQIREEIGEFDKREDELLKLYYEKLKRQDLNYCNYINDGD